MTMRRPYQIAGSLCLLLAIFIVREALSLRYYTSIGPGPGFFSFWLALIFGGLAVIMLVQASLGTSEAMPEDFFAHRIGYLRIGAVVLALMVVIYALEPVGFSLTMFGVCVFLLYVLGRQRWYLILLVSLACSFGAHHVFDRWLRVPLPKGLLGF